MPRNTEPTYAVFPEKTMFGTMYRAYRKTSFLGIPLWKSVGSHEHSRHHAEQDIQVDARNLRELQEPATYYDVNGKAL